MTDHAASMNLDRRAYGLRFVAAETEGAFRLWRNAQTLPLLQLAAVVSLLIWVAASMVPSRVSGFDFYAGNSSWMMFGIVYPTLITCMLVAHTPLRSWALFWSCLFVAVSSTTAIGLTMIEAQSVGSAVVVAFAYCLWLPFLRIPPVMALFTMSTFMVPVMVAVWSKVPADQAETMVRWTTLSMLASA